MPAGTILSSSGHPPRDVAQPRGAGVRMIIGSREASGELETRRPGKAGFEN